MNLPDNCTAIRYGGIAYFLNAVIFEVYKFIQRFQYLTFTYFFTALFFLKRIIALNHFSETNVSPVNSSSLIPFTIDKDDFGEFLLAEAMDKIAAFIQSRLSECCKPWAVRQRSDKILYQVILTNTLLIFIYIMPVVILDNRDTESFRREFVRNAQAAWRHLLFSRPDNESARKYLAVIPVKRVISAGFIILELILKRVIPENVYPGLLVDNRFRQAFGSQELSNTVSQRDSILVWWF